MRRRRPVFLTFEFVIATADGGSRGGTVSAETHEEARVQIKLHEGERIYSLNIRT